MAKRCPNPKGKYGIVLILKFEQADWNTVNPSYNDIICFQRRCH